MNKDNLEITTNEGLVIVVEETLPYEPSNYVNEAYIHLGFLKGQTTEYPLYSLSASGLVEIQYEETGKWEQVGTWDAPNEEGDWGEMPDD